MIPIFLDQLANSIAPIWVAGVAAALLAYFRSETTIALKWLLRPITARLPWHRLPPPSGGPETPALTSQQTIADVFLMTADGGRARYEKTGDYVVKADSLSSYFEGVTTSGSANNFSTELGVIVKTTRAHGFYLSQIDLGTVFKVGARFRNVYRAFVKDAFTDEEEHWTQEIAWPTDRLTLRIHFPAGRPPKLIRCKRVIGVTETQISNEATVTDLFGLTAIVWKIDRPGRVIFISSNGAGKSPDHRCTAWFYLAHHSVFPERFPPRHPEPSPVMLPYGQFCFRWLIY